MLVTFTTDTYPNITMFGDNALAMLKMMGHSATVPGAISAEDVPDALSRLTAALRASSEAPPVDAADEDEPTVSMAQRGKPLLELLAAAIKANGYVTWNHATALS